MATAPRQQVGSPQIFQTDKLEQELAKVAYGDNPATAGYAMGGLINARAERGMDQDTYLQNLHDANRMAAALATQDMNTDLLKTSLEKAPEYLKAGGNPSDVPLIGRLFTGNSGNEAAGLQRAMLQAHVNELNAKATAAAQGGQPKYQYQVVNDANGNPVTTITVSGHDPNQVATGAEQANVRVTRGRSDPDNPTPGVMQANPKAPYASTTLGQVDQRTRDAYSTANQGRPLPGTPPFKGY